MKLRNKLALSFVLLVIVSFAIFSLSINLNTEGSFRKFMKAKNAEIQGQGQVPRIYIFEEKVIIPSFYLGSQNDERVTPEAKFLKEARESLLWSAALGVLLAIIFAYLFSSLLVRKLTKLQNAMHKYHDSGELTILEVSESKDEIDDLTLMYGSLIEKVAKQEKIRREFFVDMSHELRTPLTSVKGYLEGLVDGVFDAEREKDVHKKALRETDRMIHLVKEMTVLAKMESEDMTLHKEPLNLKNLTEDVMEDFAEAINKAELKISVKGQLETLADANKLRQVLINLLDNAISHAPKGDDVQIEMGEKQGHGFWEISNTAGVEMEKQSEYFFERFFRVDKSRTRTDKAHLGIGLNIVKRIVQAHGAEVSAHYVDGRIVFSIEFANFSKG